MAGIGRITPRREKSDRGLGTAARVKSAKPVLDATPIARGLDARGRAMGDMGEAFKTIGRELYKLAGFQAEQERVESNKRVSELERDARIHSGQILAMPWRDANGAENRAIQSWSGADMVSQDVLPAAQWRQEMQRYIEQEARERGFSDADKEAFAARIAPTMEAQYLKLYDWQQGAINAEMVQGIEREQTAAAQTDRALIFTTLDMDRQSAENQERILGLRADGTKKGAGWLGRIGNDTEYAFTATVAGKEMLIPAAVPGLEDGEKVRLAALREGDEIPESIKQKAIQYAENRVAAGLEVFAPGYLAASDAEAAKMWIAGKETAIEYTAESLETRTAGQIGRQDALRRARALHEREARLDIAALTDAGAFDRARAFVGAAKDFIHPDEERKLYEAIDKAEEAWKAGEEREKTALRTENFRTRNGALDELQWQVATNVDNPAAVAIPAERQFTEELENAVAAGEIDRQSAMKLLGRYRTIAEARNNIIAAQTAQMQGQDMADGEIAWPAKSNVQALVTLKKAIFDQARENTNPDVLAGALENMQKQGLLSPQDYLSCYHEILKKRNERDDAIMNTLYSEFFEITEHEAAIVRDSEKRYGAKGEEAIDKLLGSDMAEESPGGALTIDDVYDIERQVMRYLHANPGDEAGARRLIQELLAPSVAAARQHDIKWRLKRVALALRRDKGKSDFTAIYNDNESAEQVLDGYDTPWYLEAGEWTFRKAAGLGATWEEFKKALAAPTPAGIVTKGIMSNPVP